jgi:REP element-mobilizing transposase RayT
MHQFPRVPPRLYRVFADAPVYFITFCTYRRRPLLTTAPVHHAFVAFAHCAYTAHNVAVGRYVIMPDHVHLFVRGDREFRLSGWIGMLRQSLRRGIVRPNPMSSDPIWQRGFFDHVLRSDESYREKWEYVLANPVRAGLVLQVGAWPYAGEVIPIDRA